ncbi:hypothetical protein CDD83_786 [Cordyceps sp. RAO-2017]|nr:hypothetical protein CDD83_786 [Cordyceps sp. RAO-2017]
MRPHDQGLPSTPERDSPQPDRTRLLDGENRCELLVVADKSSEESCVICLDVVTERCLLFPCGHHTFHFRCIDRWLSESSARMCPVCKAVICRVVHGSAERRQTVEYDIPLPSPPRPNFPASSPHESRVQQSLNLAVQSGHARRDCPPAQPPPARTEGHVPPDLAFRRQIYRRLLYSMHIGSNPVSRYRELSRDTFLHDRDLQSRAQLFLRRELQVFTWLSSPYSDDLVRVDGESLRSFQRRLQRAPSAEGLLAHILGLLRHFEIRGSDGSLEDDLATHIGRENTRLLLHELQSFLRSPYQSLEDWDGAVQYADAPPGGIWRADGDDGIQDENASENASFRRRSRSCEARGNQDHGHRPTGSRFRPRYRRRDMPARPESARPGHDQSSVSFHESRGRPSHRLHHNGVPRVGTIFRHDRASDVSPG